MQDLYNLQDELARIRGELEKARLDAAFGVELESDKLQAAVAESERLKKELREDKIVAKEEIQKVKDEVEKMKNEEIKLLEETQTLREEMRASRRTIDQLNLQIQLKDDGIFLTIYFYYLLYHIQLSLIYNIHFHDAST